MRFDLMYIVNDFYIAKVLPKCRCSNKNDLPMRAQFQDINIIIDNEFDIHVVLELNETTGMKS